MPLAPPGSISPGKLVVYYQTLTGVQHTAAVRLVEGGMPATQSAAELLAVEFAADMLAPAMPAATYTAVKWAFFRFFEVDNSWAEVWNGPFLEPVDGFAGPYPGEDFESVTMTIGGHGVPPDADTLWGLTRLTLYTGPGYEIPPAQNRIPITTAGYTQLATLAAALSAHDTLFADIYGQKAVANDYLTPQANAHWQRVRGL